MTTRMILRIKELNEAGMNDVMISERLGISYTTVSYWRIHKLGLPRTGVYRSKKRYIVYDGKTTQFIVEGTTKECADALHLTPATFRTAKTNFEKGIYRKYEIYEVKGDEEN